ncbi:MAG: DUF92 domain-containing protein [Terriglobales bacterium]
MSRLAIALLIPAAFALLGWAVGGVTAGGAIAGFVVAFLLFYGIGPAAFAVLFAVFVITWITTRLGRVRKHRLGIAERRRGRRSAGQVLANIGVSGSFAVLVLLQSTVPHLSPILRYVGLCIAAAIASLAEAAADTVSSEGGEAFSDTALLIPRFRRVPAGTDGAVTALGTAAAIAAAALIGSLAALLHLLPPGAAAFAALCGFLGSAIDTVLGATLERRGLVGNNAVNFASTLAAALLAIAMLAIFC